MTRGAGAHTPALALKHFTSQALDFLQRYAGYKYQKGVISRPQEPAGFVSAFENFMFDKDPFYIIKPDGTSDLTPAQQEEAAAIFDNVFDGESYLNFKYKKAAEKIGEQMRAAGISAVGNKTNGDFEKAKLPSMSEVDKDFREKVRETFLKPQSAREEIDEQRREQIELKKKEREETRSSLEAPLAEKRADEADSKLPSPARYELADPRYVVVKGADDYFGGNQGWFSEDLIRNGGCGVTALNDTIKYLTLSNGIKDAKPIEINMSDYLKGYLDVRDDLNIHGKAGTFGFDLAFYMNEYFRENNMQYEAEWGVSENKELLPAIENMLDDDIPVILSVGPHIGYKQLEENATIPLYERDERGNYSAVSSVLGHYMTVTATYPATTEHGVMLKVSSWGFS